MPIAVALLLREISPLFGSLTWSSRSCQRAERVPGSVKSSSRLMSIRQGWRRFDNTITIPSFATHHFLPVMSVRMTVRGVEILSR